MGHNEVVCRGLKESPGSKQRFEEGAHIRPPDCDYPTNDRIVTRPQDAMSGSSTPTIESNLKQACTQGTFDQNKIWTTFPLANNIGIPSANHLASLPITADEAIRLPDDPQGNARWTSSQALYYSAMSRYQPPVHPASRSLKEIIEEDQGRRGREERTASRAEAEVEEREQTEVSATAEEEEEEEESKSPEVAESFDRGEESIES